MHERNPYRDNVDFRLLAEAYPPLRPFVVSTSKGTPGIDFKNAEAQRELTQALLHRDFGLEMHSLPNDRLCPPIPNRLDYVLWIQDIVDEVAELDSGAPSVLGIDVGTGASAIYTLLACRLRSNWKMIGTDIDKNSFASAEKNVTANRLQEQITLHLSKPDERIFTPIFENPDKRFSFTMCNPPFYSTFSEAVNSPVIKEFDSFAVCTGAEVEMVTEGGEVGFVRRMILESKELKERCRWYTSLLGKSSSVPPLIEALKEQKVNNYGITELVQSHTKRWVILWSYGDIRLPDVSLMPTFERALRRFHAPAE
ncbi:hypothetical protein FRB90_011802 [Tulasnella sp. 427]|nr:hypothetical protein FRB90_011802 [Tulasnella sp. 427]